MAGASLKSSLTFLVVDGEKYFEKGQSVERDGAVVAPHQPRALAIVAGQPHFIIGFIRT
jgi:hypothetical protein